MSPSADINTTQARTQNFAHEGPPALEGARATQGPSRAEFELLYYISWVWTVQCKNAFSVCMLLITAFIQIIT